MVFVLWVNTFTAACREGAMTQEGPHLFARSPHKATCVLILRLDEVEQSECRLSTMLVGSVLSY